MTTVEWALWITNTAFQGVLAYYMIWEQLKLVRLREKQIKIVEDVKKAREAEVME